MWPRTVEVMLGLWLAASPFIFNHPASEKPLWFNDLGCAFLIVTISLLSFWRQAMSAHLLNVAVAVWLAAFGYFGFEHPLPPAAQNNLIVGLVLLIVAIIPSEVTSPPKEWRRLLQIKQENEKRQV